MHAGAESRVDSNLASGPMSALPPNADIVQHRGNVRLCPKRTHAVPQLGLLLDHLGGERQKINRQLNACGLCGLEVDDELIVGRLLERQISRPRAA